MKSSNLLLTGLVAAGVIGSVGIAMAQTTYNTPPATTMTPAQGNAPVPATSTATDPNLQTQQRTNRPGNSTNGTTNSTTGSMNNNADTNTSTMNNRNAMPRKDMSGLNNSGTEMDTERPARADRN